MSGTVLKRCSNSGMSSARPLATATLGGLFVVPPKRTERNFLRENKLQLRQLSQHNSSVLSSHNSHSYALPTAASLARRISAPALNETQRQRRVWNGGTATTRRQNPATNRLGRRCSEKQIQTEDISDEQFLNAALRKCSENGNPNGNGNGNGRVRSEGDDMMPAGINYHSNLRRTASSSCIELGRMPVQRSGYQPGQYSALLRPISSCLGTGIVPGCAMAEDSANCARKPLFLVEKKKPKQSAVQQSQPIPEITDVEPEPQLDQPLSGRSLSSTQSQASSKGNAQQVDQSTSPSSPRKQEQLAGEQQQQKKDDHEGELLLTEAQRKELIDGARARQQKLISDYNRLPLSMTTLRVRNLKIQLEQQLDLVDNDLRVLSRPQVYIKRC